MSTKAKKDKKKRIILKPKQARKIFATSVSRGPNKTRENNAKNENIQPQRINENVGIKLSSLGGHALIKQIDGTLDFEEGTTTLWAMRTFKGYGIPSHKEYDFDIGNSSKEEYKNFLRKPVPEEVLEHASITRIGWYKRLSCVADIIELFIIYLCLCVLKLLMGFIQLPKELFQCLNSGKKLRVVIL